MMVIGILPELCSGRGTMRSMVEGSAWAAVGGYPSTTLRVVPLPKTSLGRT
jgi:hypothetical protein